MAGGSPSPRGAPPYIIVVAATGAAPVNAARQPAFHKHVVRAARRMPPPPPVSQRHWPEASKEEKVNDREERLTTRATCTHRVLVLVVVVVGLRARAHSLALALAGPRPAGAVGVVVPAVRLGAHRGGRPQRGGERRRREHEPEDPSGRPRPAAGAAAAAEHAVGLWLLLSRLARGRSQLGSDQSATSKTVCCEAKLFSWGFAHYL